MNLFQIAYKCLNLLDVNFNTDSKTERIFQNSPAVLYGNLQFPFPIHLSRPALTPADPHPQTRRPAPADPHYSIYLIPE